MRISIVFVSCLDKVWPSSVISCNYSYKGITHALHKFPYHVTTAYRQVLTQNCRRSLPVQWIAEIHAIFYTLCKLTHIYYLHIFCFHIFSPPPTPLTYWFTGWHSKIKSTDAENARCLKKINLKNVYLNFVTELLSLYATSIRLLIKNLY